MKNKYLNFLVFLIVFILIANIVLFALRKINEIAFWMVIIAAAVFAYAIMPKINKK